MAIDIVDHDHHHHVPEEVLVEILLCLPVKSLLRFKCVSKKWHALIENRRFIHDHHNHQKIHDKGRLLLQHFNEDTSWSGFALFPDETLTSTAYHDLDNLWGRVNIEGPVNGLCCLSDCGDHIIMWNPSMREFRTLPIPQYSDLPPHIRVWLSNIAFGFDPINEDYKVVLFSSLSVGYPIDEDYVDLYSLSTNTWRHLNLDYLHSQCLLPESNGTYLDGVYYWWRGNSSVLAFYMGKEVFQVIACPDVPDMLPDAYGRMTLYSDNRIALCLMQSIPESDIDSSINVWVMEEEKEGSWTKLFTVGPLFPRIAWPLGLWKNGELLSVTSDSPKLHGNPNSQVVLYNPSTQETRDIGPKGDDMGFGACIYYESLVSVKGEMYEREGSLSDSDASQFIHSRNARFDLIYESDE